VEKPRLKKNGGRESPLFGKVLRNSAALEAENKPRGLRRKVRGNLFRVKDDG